MAQKKNYALGGIRIKSSRKQSWLLPAKYKRALADEKRLGGRKWPRDRLSSVPSIEGFSQFPQYVPCVSGNKKRVETTTSASQGYRKGDPDYDLPYVYFGGATLNIFDYVVRAQRRPSPPN